MKRERNQTTIPRNPGLPASSLSFGCLALLGGSLGRIDFLENGCQPRSALHPTVEFEDEQEHDDQAYAQDDECTGEDDHPA